MNLPKSTQEWNEFASIYKGENAGVVLAAVGGDRPVGEPIAAVSGSYGAIVVCLSAIIRNLADGTNVKEDVVLDDIRTTIAANKWEGTRG